MAKDGDGKVKETIENLSIAALSALGWDVAKKILFNQGTQVLNDKRKELASHVRPRFNRDIHLLERSERPEYKSAAQNYWRRQEEALKKKDGSENRLNQLLSTVMEPLYEETERAVVAEKGADDKPKTVVNPDKDLNQDKRLEELAHILNKGDAEFELELSQLEHDWIEQTIDQLIKKSGFLGRQFWTWASGYTNKFADTAEGALKRAKKTREDKKVWLHIRLGKRNIKFRGVDPSNIFDSPLKNTHEWLGGLADELETRDRSAKRKTRAAAKKAKTAAQDTTIADKELK
ncbi:MAG: hypothetical protein Q7S28_01490 [bacterium]|nr:hypothetical protein [bacterium]